MRGAIPPLFQYALMAWCLVKTQGQLYLIPYLHTKDHLFVGCNYKIQL